MSVRRLSAACIAFLGLCVIGIGTILGMSGGMIEDTIANSRKIEVMFLSVSSYVDNFREKEGRLPTASEFDSWKLRQPDGVYSVRNVYLDSPNNSEEIVRQFSRPSSGSYLLTYWRGEWFEHYASWAKKSTLVFDKRAYHVLGSSIADGFAAAGFGVVLLAFAGWLWRRPTMRPNGRAANGAPLS